MHSEHSQIESSESKIDTTISDYTTRTRKKSIKGGYNDIFSLL